MAFSYNCRGITVRDCTLRNFVRQGIQMGGSPGSRDYLVTGCRDLEHTVQPGGSTIHVEHARGLENVIIENNQCRKSILAGGVDGMIIRGNTVMGRIVGNSNTNLLVSDNIVRAAGALRRRCSIRLHEGIDHSRQHHPRHGEQPSRPLRMGQLPLQPTAGRKRA